MTYALSRDVLEAAARWYVELSCAPADAALEREHRRWLAADPAHCAAWERVALLRERLERITPGVGERTLNTAFARRRATLKVLGVLLMTGGTGWLGWQQTPVRALFASVQSGVGEQRRLTLDDGTQLALNTNSAVNIRYNLQVRNIELVQGEIAVHSAADSLLRPLLVHTASGSVQALGTRFVVREEEQGTAVTVQEHAVAVRPLLAPDQPTRIEAGQRVRFDRARTGPVTAAQGHEDAWTGGILIVSDWRLEDFIAELSRYRSGHLGCAREVAALRISGAFQLADTDAVLRNLSSTLPVAIRRFSRFWVSVESA
ncbi:FecR domain-containing protein [Pseudomonas sp. GZD-222]|uniref:FecR domain-containing protein n=1 Tax=Pseudomonas sp. GZD-222 TaxID=3404805 RepID=UPI003BB6406F